jgi:hypothetical protein
MFLPIEGKKKIGQIELTEIICERIKPRISKKFSTSVQQFNLYLQRPPPKNTFDLNPENVDILRSTLNKLYRNVNQELNVGENKYFQMNLTLKGNFCYYG